MKSVQIVMALISISCTHTDHVEQEKVRDTISYSQDMYKRVDKKGGIVDTENIALNMDSLHNTILDIVYAIPEVKKKDNYIQNLTQGKNGVTMIIQQEPTKEEPYYLVQVGYNNPTTFEVFYNFYVYQKTLEVKVLDVVSGNVITLNEWRKKKE